MIVPELGSGRALISQVFRWHVSTRFVDVELMARR